MIPVKEHDEPETATSETNNLFNKIKLIVMEQKNDTSPELAKEKTSEVITENDDTQKNQEKQKQYGAEYGTIMHRAFELYLANKKINHAADEKTLESFVVQAVLEVKTDENAFELYYKPILKNLLRFVKEFESRYQDSQTAMETPIFCIFDEDNEMMKFIKDNLDDTKNASKAYFSGYSDLIVFTDDKPSCIIDYKSDRKKYTDESKTACEDDETYKSRLVEKYKPQQEAYAKCFNALMGNVKQKMTLYTANAESVLWIEN